MISQRQSIYLGLGIISGLAAISSLVGCNILAPTNKSHAEEATSPAQSVAWVAVDSSITPAILDTSQAVNNITTSSQTISVKTNSVRGYTVVAMPTISTATAMMRASKTTSEADVTTSIPMTTNTSLADLSDKTWGVNTSGSTTTFAALSSTGTGGATIVVSKPTTTAASVANDTAAAAKHTYTYGVRVNKATEVPVGVYTTNVTYSITAQLPSNVTVTNLTPTEFRYSKSIAQSNTMTITGTNLDSVYRVYLTPTDLSAADQALASNQYDCAITSATSESISCKIPNNDAGSPLSDMMAGTTGRHYDVHVLSQASDDSKEITKKNSFAYYKVREIAGTASHRTPSDTDKTQFGAADSTDSFNVTLDPHMIPIKYTGSSYKSDTTAQGAAETAKWAVVTNSELAADSDNWFNYDNTFDASGKITGKTAKWANAITVKADKLDKYLKCEENGASSADCTNIPEDDVLGYWVYIPRFAYRVRRYQASDKFVGERNFDIHFETASTPKSIPAASCNPSPTEATAADIWTDGNPDNRQSNIKVAYYEDSCTGDKAINKTYHGTTPADNQYTGTSWATHPAFTFGNVELSGFWMAKYEMTGSRTQQYGDKTGPTIKPGLVSNTSEPIGQYMAMAKSIGISETNYNGNYVDENKGYDKLTKDSHSLGMYAGMLSTNKQWGAAVYLSSSQYGAGVNNVQNNGYDNWYKTSTNSSGQTVYSRQVDADGDVISYCYDNNCFSTDGTDSNDSGTTVNSNNNSKPISVIGGQLTGCGPYTNGSDDAYNKGGIGEIYRGKDTMKNAECAAGNDHAYQGSLGVLASTTNNVYGIYDMAGGNWDHVAANLTNRIGKTASTAYKTQTGYQFMGNVITSEMTSPYVDLFNGDDGAGNTTNKHSYDIDTEWMENNGKPSFTLQAKDNYTYANSGNSLATSAEYTTMTNWSTQTGDVSSNFYNNDYCTWGECGGGALHETKNRQSVNGHYSSWGSDYSHFPNAQASWLVRGGRVGDTSSAGVFASHNVDGWGSGNRSARVVAAELPVGK